MQKLDVYISVKSKYKQKTKSVLVKSLEQNSHCVYEARAYVLNYTPDDSLEPTPRPEVQNERMNTPTRMTTPSNSTSAAFNEGTTSPTVQGGTDSLGEDTHTHSSSSSSGYDTGTEPMDRSKIVKTVPERSPSPKTVTICECVCVCVCVCV